MWCWAETDTAAGEIAADVRTAVWALAGTERLGPVVYTVTELLGPTQADDPRSGTPRIWATYELLVRADTVR